MKYIFFIAVLFSLTGCSYSFDVSPYPQDECYYVEDEYVDQGDGTPIDWAVVDWAAVSRVVYDYTIGLKHDQRLILENAYLDQKDGEVRIRLDFISQDLKDVRQARYLLVDTVEGMLKAIKKNEILSSQLPRSLTSNDLDVNINFECYWGKYGDPFFVGWAMLQKGTAYYYACDIKTKNIDWWNSRIEPYYKSLGFATFERSSEAAYKASLPVRTPSKLEKERFVETKPKS